MLIFLHSTKDSWKELVENIQSKTVADPENFGGWDDKIYKHKLRII